MDFKENIILGGRSIEIDRDHYSKRPNSVFGIAIYQKIGDETKIVYHDFVSEVLNHDSLFVNDCLNKWTNTSDFRSSKFRSLSFWMDNGPAHFRTYENIATFVNLKKELKIDISFHYFCEYHGKNICDTHFSTLSRYLKQHENAAESVVHSTEDVIKVFEEQTKRANDNKKTRNLKRKATTEKETISEVHFHSYNRTTQPEKKKQVEVKDFCCFHSFKVEEKTIKCFPLTGHTSSKEQQIKEKQTANSPPLRNAFSKRKANPFEKHIINLSKKAKITHPNKNDIIPSSDDDSVLAGMMARFSFAM